MGYLLTDKRREFIARTVANSGIALFTVALASYFFERFPLVLRIILGIVCLGFIIGSFFIYPPDAGA